ncbi:MAG: hypothetical protein JWQ51_906 [Tardiphaga sp.]|nr:hypothetical protein [Tardiphaga sp.]
MSKRASKNSGTNASQRALDAAIHAMRMQQPVEAERRSAEVLASDANHVLALQIFGHALLLQNRAGEAIAPLERAAKHSDDPAIETLLATALAGGGRRDEALAQLARTTARRPLYPPAVLEHSAQLSQVGRLDAATAVLEAALARAPGIAEFKLELGFHHLRRNDRLRARALFAEVSAAAPERHDAATALARIMALDGDYATAADLYRGVLARHPNDVMSRNNLAICLLETGDRDAGEASLRDAVRAAPQITGQAMTAMAAASHGRFFLRPSAAASFLRDGNG